MKALIHVGVAATMLLVGSMPGTAAAADESPAQATVEARWVPRELHFTYMGFTSTYSCDGLLDQMKQILQQLGAGEDLVIKTYGCSTPSGPQVMAGVQATFSVLVPADSSEQGSAGSAVVAARWDAVKMDADIPRHRNSGDCELIEQVKKEVLPLFTTRNLTFRSSCFPHQASIAGAHLSVEVLRPAQPAAGPGH
jgi:hypothetical protein